MYGPQGNPLDTSSKCPVGRALYFKLSFALHHWDHKASPDPSRCFVKYNESLPRYHIVSCMAADQARSPRITSCFLRPPVIRNMEIQTTDYLFTHFCRFQYRLNLLYLVGPSGFRYFLGTCLVHAVRYVSPVLRSSDTQAFQFDSSIVRWGHRGTLGSWRRVVVFSHRRCVLSHT